jgi:polysaccharide biosynthesis protein PslG
VNPGTPAQPVAGRSNGVRWGIVTGNWGLLPDGPALDRMKTTGVGWIREELNFAPNAESESVYLEAARRGLRVLPLLQKDSLLPTDVGAYAEVVAAHVRRYGPGGEFWLAHPELNPALASTHFELYNEPYGAWFGPVEPARYASVLRAVVPRARQANPRAAFLMAIDHTPGGERLTWIDELYRAVPNLNDYFDAVSMHPYSGNRAPDEAGDPWGFQRIAEARAAMERHGAGSKPFWITEVGWTTCPNDPQWCVSEAQQAAYMERAAEMARTRYGFVEALFYYNFCSGEGNPADSEDFFGILHADLTPKPAYHALRRITGAAG